MPPRRPSGIRFALAAAVIVWQLACPVAIALHGADLAGGNYSTQSDAARYRSIARMHGTPYRDFDVEYPPLALGLFRAVGPRSFDGFRERLFALQVACQALTVFLLFRCWSGRAGWSYLALSTPMLFVVYTGFDLVAVAIAVAGAALVRGRRPLAGASGFVVGAFTKIWPVALLPSLLVRRKVRAFTTAAAVGAAGLAAWALWGGADAIGQVLTYRGARGWEYESVPGSALRLLSGDALHLEAGSWRVGAPPRFVSTALVVVLLGVVAAIWWTAVRRPPPDGLAEAAAVAALLALGTLLSPQFVIWPLPFVAIAAAAGERRAEAWASAASVLTLVDWVLFDPHHPAAAAGELVIVGRNVALVGLLVVAIQGLRTRVAATQEPVGA